MLARYSIWNDRNQHLVQVKAKNTHVETRQYDSYGFKNSTSGEGRDARQKVEDLLPPMATRKQKIMMVAAVTIPPTGMVAAMILLWQYGWMGWLYLAMVVAGWLITVSGVTVGFHRLLSHRSFETYGWVKAAWAMIGALSVQGNPLVWCAIHRRHHERSDKIGDPHSPNLHGSGIRGMLRGLWHGQVGWLFSGFWSYPDLKGTFPIS